MLKSHPFAENVAKHIAENESMFGFEIPQKGTGFKIGLRVMFQDDDSEGKVNNPGSNGEGPDETASRGRRNEDSKRKRQREGEEGIRIDGLHVHPLRFSSVHTQDIIEQGELNLAMMSLQPAISAALAGALTQMVTGHD